jgi:hypothetical protein
MEAEKRNQANDPQNESILVTTITGGGNIKRDRRAPTMRNIMRQRKLFISRNGYIGIGPVNSQPDDVVFIISGCNFPIVLRPKGDNFAVVGEAYGE